MNSESYYGGKAQKSMNQEAYTLLLLIGDEIIPVKNSEFLVVKERVKIGFVWGGGAFLAQ
jgi:hypothetical protein